MNWLWYKRDSITPKRLPIDPTSVTTRKGTDKPIILPWFDSKPYDEKNDVYDNGTEVSSFGAAVVIGEVGTDKSNIQITSGAINLRQNTTTKMSLSTAGVITIGSNVTIAADGTAEFDGSITGGSLSIGSSNTILRVDTDGDLWIGHATQGSAPFQVANTGAVIASNLTITGGSLSVGSSNTILLSIALIQHSIYHIYI